MDDLTLFVFAATGCPVFLFLDGPAVDTSDPTGTLSLMSRDSSPGCLKLQVLRCPGLLGQGEGWGPVLTGVKAPWPWAPGSLATTSCWSSFHQRPSSNTLCNKERLPSEEGHPSAHVCPALNPAGTFSSAATAVQVIPLLWVTGCRLPDGFGRLC